MPRSVSPFSKRLLATLALFAAAVLVGAPAFPAAAAAPTDATWLPLPAPSSDLANPLLALAVSPTDSRVVLVGTDDGSIYRSIDGGGSWKPVHRLPGHAILTLAFDAYQPGLVLAGARSAGVFRSADAGVTWTPQPGLEKISARSFGFTKSMALAGSDKGVFVAHGTDAWLPSGLAQINVGAVAAVTLSDPTKLLAGGDGADPGIALPLFQSPDGGNTWTEVPGQARAGSIVSALAAGGPQGNVRTLLMGTNTGLYASIDNGASWNGPLSGGGTLPATDFNQVVFVRDRFDRFYAASDGGGSDSGGLWYTGDGGSHFTSLQPPLPEVTAIAVSNDAQPTLYVATFRPSDHAIFLWSYHDTGAAPRQPVGGVPAPAGKAPAAASTQAAQQADWFLLLLRGPEAPYLVIGVGAVVILLFTLVSYVRSGARRRR
jgi:photosystem II stability/assembly factor-like uncharacterized protein